MTDTASPTTRQLQDAYALAKERYAALDVDTDQALVTLGQISLSLHCPTEVISDKISAALLFVPAVVLHISRPVRWDSDHVVTLTDEVQAILREIVATGNLDRVHIGLDFFDASINRIAAWVIGARNVLRAALLALLEPTDRLRAFETGGDFTARLALLEELKGLPWAAMWDQFCLQQDVPIGIQFLDEVKQYEAQELSNRV